MVRRKIKNSFLSKTLTFALILSFSFYNVSFSITEENIASPVTAGINMQDPLNVTDVGIAIDAGTIKSKYSGETGKVIVHIQDAHCNYEAQSNINKMLDQLTRECGIEMISVEGAEGLVDTAWFRAFPDAEIRKEVANYFMKKGEITGAEFFSITSDYEGTIFGAETKDYYIKNLKAFTEVYPHKEAIEKYLKDTQVVTNRLKSMIYPPRLKALDAKIRGFAGKEVELSDYAAYLQKMLKKYRIQEAKHPNLKKLFQTLEYEDKIDFDIVDKERSKYIDTLAKKMSKDQMTELVTQSIKFKKGHIKAVNFYSYLRDLAKEYKIDMVNEYPNLFYYYIYTKLYDGINNEGLFREIDIVERELKGKLFKNDTQRQLDKFATMIDMYIALANIELTNEDYELFQVYSSESSIEDVMGFFNGLVNKYNLNFDLGDIPLQITNQLPNMVAFYEVAMKRDKALIDNTLNQMDQDGKDRCVLIAGGFHTKGIKNLLEEQGVSYVVVTPKITKDVETPYIKVLTNQRTTIEDIITESAMPGTVEAKEMLCPVLQMAYAIPMLLDPNQKKELDAMSEVMGKVADGETLKESAKRKLNEMVEMNASLWIEKIREGLKEKGQEKEWKSFIKEDEKWNLLLGIFIRKYEENLEKEMAPVVKTDVVTTFDVVRKTPGVQDAMGEVLTGDEAENFDEVLRQSFADGANEEIKTFVRGREVLVQKHYGLNAALALRGLPPNVHPGRGSKHDLLQIHIDGDVWDSLTSQEQETIINHELVHLDIFNVERAIEVYMPSVLAKLGLADTEENRKEVEKKHYKDLVEAVMNNVLGITTNVEDESTGIWTAWRDYKKDALGDEAQLQEDFVNGIAGCDTTAIVSKLNSSKPGTVEYMEKAILEDTAFGDTAIEYIMNTRRGIAVLPEGAKKNDLIKELKLTIQQVYTRRQNIDKMQNTFTSDKYTGYDVIIISSSNGDEAEYQQKVLEKAFEGRKTDNDAMGNKVCILSVLDDCEGGQIIGQGFTWFKAVEKFKGWAEKNNLETTNLDEIFKQNQAKVAIYHNGGQGKRASPATQALGNSRGAQDIVGSVINARNEEVPINLILSVVLQTLPMSSTNDSSRVDTFWTNQVAFGTIDFTNLERTNYHFDKFVIAVPEKPKNKDLFDYGTAILSKAGKIFKFIANKSLTKKNKTTGLFERTDDKYYSNKLDELLKAPKGAFDFGSFSMSREMHYALLDYWTNRGVFDAIKNDVDNKSPFERDIDKALVQVMVPLFSGLSGKTLPDLPTKFQLGVWGAEQKAVALEEAYQKLKATMTDQDLIDALNIIYGIVIKPSFSSLGSSVDDLFQDLINNGYMNKERELSLVFSGLKSEDEMKLNNVYLNADEKNQKKAIFKSLKETQANYEKKRPFILEAVEIFILYQDVLFSDFDKVVGHIDMGSDSHWFAYKRLLDMGNEKFLMLGDILGVVPELMPRICSLVKFSYLSSITFCNSPLVLLSTV